MGNLIIPAAGKSSRFDTSVPKWMLKHPTGLTMLELVINPFLETDDDIFLITTTEIARTHKVRDFLKSKFGGKIEMVVVPYQTSSQSETVFYFLDNYFDKTDVPFYFKDTDSYVGFDSTDLTGNFVYGLDVNKNNWLKQIDNKSFLFVEDGKVIGIKEKQRVSNIISTGLYGFRSSDCFRSCYTDIKFEDLTGEIYPSKVIQMCIGKGEKFLFRDTLDYKDWGTQDDWNDEIKNY
jgi:choline kinase